MRLKTETQFWLGHNGTSQKSMLNLSEERILFSMQYKRWEQEREKETPVNETTAKWKIRTEMKFFDFFAFEMVSLSRLLSMLEIASNIEIDWTPANRLEAETNEIRLSFRVLHLYWNGIENAKMNREKSDFFFLDFLMSLQDKENVDKGILKIIYVISDIQLFPNPAIALSFDAI